MSSQKGLLMTCARCATTEFRPFVKTQYTDGGYTKYDTYAEPKKPWGLRVIGSDEKYRDLCPECYKQLLEFEDQFLNYRIKKQCRTCYWANPEKDYDCTNLKVLEIPGDQILDKENNCILWKGEQA